MPILGEGERDFAQMSFAQMSLRANVTQPFKKWCHDLERHFIVIIYTPIDIL